MEKKVYLETYGCQMNVHDSEKAIRMFSDLGYSQTSEVSEADIVLLNTCMVREKAARKVFARINEIKKELRRNHQGPGAGPRVGPSGGSMCALLIARAFSLKCP